MPDPAPGAPSTTATDSPHTYSGACDGYGITPSVDSWNQFCEKMRNLSDGGTPIRAVENCFFPEGREDDTYILIPDEFHG